MAAGDGTAARGLDSANEDSTASLRLGRRSGAFSEIKGREFGLYPDRASLRRIAGAEVLAKRMSIYRKLNAHKGCVNTVAFNPTGDILVSGSDDQDIILWDWFAGTKKLVYHSGHTDNVFQAYIMPFTDNHTVISAAADGQVRMANLKHDGSVSTKQIGEHDGRVHSLAIEPGSPYIFYSCGEDGVVHHFDLRSNPPSTQMFTCNSFHGERLAISLNALAIDPSNPNYFSLGGSDEYVRLFDVRKLDPGSSGHSGDYQHVDTFAPSHIIGPSVIHITGLAYSKYGELLVSYNDELIYLFQQDMGLGPNPPLAATANHATPQAYSGHRNAQTVKGVNFFGPNDDYVVSGSDCGHVYIWKKKGGQLMSFAVGDKQIVNCVERHPFFPFLAISGLDKTVKMWMPLSRRASLPKMAKEVMATNQRGREARARINMCPEIIWQLLRLQRTQAMFAGNEIFEGEENQVENLLAELSDAGEDSGGGTSARECGVS